MNTEKINNILDEINSEIDYSSPSDIDDVFLDLDYLPEPNTFEDDLDGIYCLNSDEEPQVYDRTQLEGPDIIEATDSDSSNYDTVNLNGKKRKVKTANWKRNISKNRRNTGKDYISSFSNKLIPKRVTGPDCKCVWKCFSKITDQDKVSVLEMFNSIVEKEKQDTFLCGLISVNSIVRRRPKSGMSGENRSCSCKYKIRIGINEIIVCKKAFCSLFGIGKAVVERLVRNIKSNNPSPKDLRGKHGIRQNKIPEDVIFKIKAHIESFPKQESHYSRNDSRVQYLSPELSIAKMYKMFLEKYDPNIFELMKNDKNAKPAVKYKFFCEYFNNNFNLSFGCPRSDTCQKCDHLQNVIKSEIDLEAKHQLELEKEIHLKKAQIFYDDLKKCIKEAKENSEVEVLSFDFQQNMPLPHIPCGDVFYKRQLWCYNLCIYSGKTGQSYFYMYDEITGKKGQNEVISFLNHFLKNKLSSGVKKMYIFTDNCSSQNKNKALFQYLYTIVKSSLFGLENILHRYPEPGHSFLPCDRCFGLIEKNKRKIERVFVPDEYQEMVKKTSKKFCVIAVTQDIMFNFFDYTKPLFKKTLCSVQKTKFTIMAYRYMKYTKEGLFCSISENGIGLEEFHLEKKGVVLKFPEDNLPKLHHGVLKIKHLKYLDVQDLAAKYVPSKFLWYYNLLISDDLEGDTLDQIYSDDDYVN